MSETTLDIYGHICSVSRITSISASSKCFRKFILNENMPLVRVSLQVWLLAAISSLLVIVIEKMTLPLQEKAGHIHCDLVGDTILC